VNTLLKKIVATSAVQKPLALSKKLVIPGFDGIPLYEVFVFLIKGLQTNSLTTRASSLAFRFFLALFPTFIFLLSIIPFIPIENFHAQLMLLIEQVLPSSAYELAISTIDDLVNHKNSELLSFGFIFAIYLASDGVNSMIIAFNDSYHTTKEVSFIRQRLISLLLLVILTLLMVIAIGLIVFSKVIITYLISLGLLTDGISVLMLTIGKFIVLIGVFFLGISSIYYYGNIGNSKFRFISAGSTLATLLIMLLSWGFAFYINNFGTYNKVYGSIGTLIVIMLWLYFNSLVLLIGFELNASIEHAKQNKNKTI
jgi:membrane protein